MNKVQQSFSALFNFPIQYDCLLKMVYQRKCDTRPLSKNKQFVDMVSECPEIYTEAICDLIEIGFIQMIPNLLFLEIDGTMSYNHYIFRTLRIKDLGEKYVNSKYTDIKSEYKSISPEELLKSLDNNALSDSDYRETIQNEGKLWSMLNIGIDYIYKH